MPKQAKTGINFLSPKHILCKLFCHPYAASFMIVASFQMIFQIWSEARGYVINNQGARLLSDIFSASTTRPDQPNNPLSSLHAPIKRSIPSQRRSLPDRHKLLKLRRGTPAPASRELNVTRTTEASSNNRTLVLSDETNRNGARTLQVDSESNTKPKTAAKNVQLISTQTKLNTTNRDPVVADILEQGNSQNRNTPSANLLQLTNRTANLAAPGAIFLLDDNLINLSAKCLSALRSPLIMIIHSRRSELAKIVFQVWLWGITIWGLMLDSIPHLAAVWVCHLLSALFEVLNFRKTKLSQRWYSKIIDRDCDGIDLLPSFWERLLQFNLVSLVISSITLLALSLLGWKLYGVLDWRIFKRLGANRLIRIAYMLSLIFSVFIQLNAYFVVCFMGMWFQEILNHEWELSLSYPENSIVLKAIMAIFMGLSLPWLFLGKWSLENESMIGIIIFAIFDLLFTSLIVFLLSQSIYERMTHRWFFLKFTGIIACILMFASLLLAIGCVMMFDKGVVKEANRDSFQLPTSVERLSITEGGKEVVSISNAPTPQLNTFQTSNVETIHLNTNVQYPHPALQSQTHQDRSPVTSTLSHSTFRDLPSPQKKIRAVPSWIPGDEAKWSDVPKSKHKSYETTSTKGSSYSYA